MKGEGGAKKEREDGKKKTGKKRLSKGNSNNKYEHQRAGYTMAKSRHSHDQSFVQH